MMHYNIYIYMELYHQYVGVYIPIDVTVNSLLRLFDMPCFL